MNCYSDDGHSWHFRIFQPKFADLIRTHLVEIKNDGGFLNFIAP
jgi:hypothetical protein